ncbi:MAG: helix-turn-helix domain-containing protein [Sphaerochaetaceae bacterium]
MPVYQIRKLPTQCSLILNHLRKGHSITQRSALMDFGVMALPRRIADLKEKGYRIKTVMEHNKLTGQRYARYSLDRATGQEG